MTDFSGEGRAVSLVPGEEPATVAAAVPTSVVTHEQQGARTGDYALVALATVSHDSLSLDQAEARGIAFSDNDQTHEIWEVHPDWMGRDTMREGCPVLSLHLARGVGPSNGAVWSVGCVRDSGGAEVTGPRSLWFGLTDPRLHPLTQPIYLSSARIHLDDASEGLSRTMLHRDAAVAHLGEETFLVAWVDSDTDRQEPLVRVLRVSCVPRDGTTP
jgi:hypothetical protein